MPETTPHRITRREFLQKAGAVLGLLAAGAAGSACVPLSPPTPSPTEAPPPTPTEGPLATLAWGEIADLSNLKELCGRTTNEMEIAKNIYAEVVPVVLAIPLVVDLSPEQREETLSKLRSITMEGVADPFKPFDFYYQFLLGLGIDVRGGGNIWQIVSPQDPLIWKMGNHFINNTKDSSTPIVALDFTGDPDFGPEQERATLEKDIIEARDYLKAWRDSHYLESEYDIRFYAVDKFLDDQLKIGLPNVRYFGIDPEEEGGVIEKGWPMAQASSTLGTGSINGIFLSRAFHFFPPALKAAVIFKEAISPGMRLYIDTVISQTQAESCPS